MHSDWWTINFNIKSLNNWKSYVTFKKKFKRLDCGCDSVTEDALSVWVWSPAPQLFQRIYFYYHLIIIYKQGT